jgi:hypothetical protein
LKKRTKKLFLLASGVVFNAETRALPVMSKSFLLLFFKKEDLSSLVARSDDLGFRHASAQLLQNMLCYNIRFVGAVVGDGDATMGLGVAAGGRDGDGRAGAARERGDCRQGQTAQ